MYFDTDSDKINHKITNDNLECEKYGNNITDFKIKNNEAFSHPFRKHHYDVHLHDLKGNFYINNGKPVIGVFENVTFLRRSFFDNTIFRGVIFKDCVFVNIGIRDCKFEKCQFINCEGSFETVERSTIKKDCVFEDSLININRVSGYLFYNSERKTSSRYIPWIPWSPGK